MFGFFLQDLNQQLRQAHTDFISTRLHTNDLIVKTYRGQTMSRTEIELLYEDNIITDQRIVINSLFSTSYDRLVALHFLPEPEQLEEQLERVLFEVKIDAHQQQTHSFSDVSQLSAIPDESEILFMTGTHFYIDAGSIKYDESEKVWIVKLKLAEDFHMKQDKDFIYSLNDDKKTLKNCIAILLDNIRHALPEELDKIFDGLLHMYPQNAKWISALKFHCLAKYYQYPDRMSYTEALRNYNKALSLWSECINDHNDRLNHAVDIGKLYKDLAWFYQYNMNDNQLADSHYNLSIELNQLAHASAATSANEHIDLLHRLSDIYENKMKLITRELNRKQDYGLLAINFKQEEIQARKNRNDFSDYDQIIISTGQIARLYKAINKYDEALFWYEKVLEIELREEPICYYSIDEIYKEIIQIYTDRQNPGDYQLVEKYKLMMHENLLKMNHVSSEFDYSDKDEKTEITRGHL
ncbi:unnamed protein product [Rotaria sp. Silwood2]|nr:unnamed protein product [Rotaria sp. Silwood2]CAF3119363.1 unnamed protein product [Rotaria sp. Silwood2]CAF3477136.1 unnamed protein product [Rotaria sp. Silwood2]CAF4435902.1 unnamed protein product [Rotaria sp. Silwood2]CAF4552871.1 unnamed protein product [Rotaria sp. Silwood2]